MKKAFITGAAGFAGGFLTEHLLSNGIAVTGTYLSSDQLKFTSEFKEAKFVKLDLLDADATLKLIKDEKPDYIFHLAALTSPSESFSNPSLTITNNITAQVNVLEAMKNGAVDATALIISSADVYGVVDEKDLPIDEETPFMPVNPYAVSKLTQDFLALQYFLSYDLKIVRVRQFNHIGPRQSTRFVVPAFANQIAQIEKGQQEPVIKVGNLTAKRDFTGVRDIARAYLLAVEKGKAGDVYNIGSGKSYIVSEILDNLLSLSSKKILVETDKDKLRPKDEPDLVCDNSKFTNITGWEPEINIEQTLKDTLDYWRNIV